MKQLIILGTLLIICFSLKSQSLRDTVIFLKTNGEYVEEAVADNKIELTMNPGSNYIVKYYFKNDKSIWKLNDHSSLIEFENDSIQKEYSYVKKKLEFSKTRIWRKTNGSLYLFKELKNNGEYSSEYYSRFIIPISKDSIETLYYPDINQKLMECSIRNNIYTSCSLFDRSGNLLEKDLIRTAEIPPKYDNKDLQFFREVVQRELIYPPYAVENGIFGRVIVQFVILSNGSLGSVNILRGVDKSLDDECIRAIKAVKSRWTPGYEKGYPVNVLCIMPLIFMLQ